MSIHSYADAPFRWQIGFQEAATPIMEGIINFHLDLMFYLCVISFFVFYLLLQTIFQFGTPKHEEDIVIDEPSKFTHHSTLEIIWTIIPVFILASIAVPSLGLLYATEEFPQPKVTLKVVGHQWYWTYEYSDEENTILYDSYLIPNSALLKGRFRLLEVDQRAVLPSKTDVRILVTSADVLHAWAIPSLGIKIDSCPGRLNQINTYINREGVFYGQCSELCGINHGFMPIVVETIKPKIFKFWLEHKIT